MNRKIFAELVNKTNNDVSKVTSQLIKDTFDVDFDKTYHNTRIDEVVMVYNLDYEFYLYVLIVIF